MLLRAAHISKHCVCVPPGRVIKCGFVPEGTAGWSREARQGMVMRQDPSVASGEQNRRAEKAVPLMSLE